MDLSLDYTPTSDSYLDLVLISGDLVLTSDANPAGTNPVLQNVQQALRSFEGEWFLDLAQGIPWFQSILQKGTTRAERETILREAILSAPGLLQLDSFNTTQDNKLRKMTVTFSGKTTYGAINNSVDIEYAGGAQ